MSNNVENFQDQELPTFAPQFKTRVGYGSSGPVIVSLVSVLTQNTTAAYEGPFDSLSTGLLGSKIRQLNAAENFQLDPALDVFKWAAGDNGRAVLSVDLTSYSNATITDAILRLNIRTQYAIASGYQVGVYALKVPFTPSEVSWSNKSAGSPWSTPGAIGLEDVESTPAATLDVSANTVGQWVTFTGLGPLLESHKGDFLYLLLERTDVQSGVGPLQDANGYIGRSIGFYSPAATSGLRPELVISYDAPQ